MVDVLHSAVERHLQNKADDFQQTFPGQAFSAESANPDRATMPAICFQVKLKTLGQKKSDRIGKSNVIWIDTNFAGK